MMQTGFHQSYLQEFMWIYFLKLYKCYIFILWQDDVTKKLAFSSVNCSVRSSHICLVLTNLLRYFILLCFFFLSFSLLYQCLSAVQMKCHILLLSVFCGVLYFGCVLKYNHAMFKKKGKVWWGASLVVQWLEQRASIAGVIGLILSRESKIPQAVGCRGKKNNTSLCTLGDNDVFMGHVDSPVVKIHYCRVGCP